MAMDPVDDCTFWYATEYMAVSGDRPWQTHIACFALPNCPGSQCSCTPPHDTLADPRTNAEPNAELLWEGNRVHI